MKTNIPEFLLTKLRDQYNDELVKQIINGYNEKKVTTFRVNTLKCSIETVLEIFNEKKIKIEQSSWNENAFLIEDIKQEDIKNLKIYDEGYIYLQSFSSMLPVIILNPKEKENILDMTAAPGSKTTQIAMITKNKSFITACEKNKIRQDRLKYNLQKQGVTCCTVIHQDAREIDDFFSFDKVLLDAPCSGSGTITIDKNYKIFNQEQLDKLQKLQISLLKKALKVLKKNEKMVYSTCSILVDENENVINEVKKEFNIEIIPIELGSNQIPLLPTKIPGTICICPNKYFEGFFVALIKKL